MPSLLTSIVARLTRPPGASRFLCTIVLGIAAVGSPWYREAKAEEHAEAYVEPPLVTADRDHWAFQPLLPVEPPEVVSSPWCRNEIDSFVLAELQAVDLHPQPSAPRRTLIRRLTLDLTGLPPTPDEISAFEQDHSPAAYRRLVDRLLASPGYGQRWATHWLDLARFAETDGFEHDRIRTGAWEYRDWVIDALNRDLPYDEFVRQQIAGDEMYPGDTTATTATRFCLSGPDMPDINLIDERRATVLNELTATVGEVVLGMQVGCAECHDHKFDPISQADFYRLRANFGPALRLQKNESLSVFQEQAPYDRPSRILLRGDFRRPGPEIDPGVLRVLTSVASTYDPQPTPTSSGRRTALANWLTDPRNPLTARVIVNRLWQHHFGRGLVRTPSDFGLMGETPSHPALLDWLAQFLIEHDWSLKKLHAKIMGSATYRQRSFLPADAAVADRRHWQAALQADPAAVSLSRYPRWRLEGEAIRDAMLLSAGQLNFKSGGPGIRPPLSAELVNTLLKNQWDVTADPAEHHRRSIYVFARRNLRYPIFAVFDRPSSNASCPSRNVSTTAPQSLYLLNSTFTWDTSRQLAARIRDQQPDPSTHASAAFERILGRLPSGQERLAIDTFWQHHRAIQSDPLTHLCLSLFNCNEFVIVD